MCISILQVPKCRIHLLANSCWESVSCWRRTFGHNSRPALLDCRTFAFNGGKRWSRRHVSSNTQGRNKNTKSSSGILGDTVSPSGILDVNKTEISEIQKIQYCDSRQKLAENKDLSSLLTVIVCDIETTGLSRAYERIIEFASQDLAGGENSTFETLINPGFLIPNSHIHGITDHMVHKPEVPRMEELIPILLQYVRSREKKPDGYVLWVAHNGRRFDFPFMINEFKRCSYEIPSNWLFLDTLPLVRELMKSSGSKISSGLSLEALGHYYEFPRVGSAHRAMSDVSLLSRVFQRITFDMKLSLADLVLRSVTTQDMTNVKKKKNLG